MRSFLMSSIAGLFVLIPGALAETSVGADAQTGIAVTIYNNNLALVTDSRKVPLVAGENEIAIIEVSAGIRPESALLTSNAASIDILEQNFDFDLLSPQKLLEKSVGQTIRIIRQHPQTGEDREEEATVLSVAEGGVVLKIGDRIEVTPPGRLVYSAVPVNLRARPTLVVRFTSDKAGEIPMDLRYLTQGLSWNADYVANLSPDEKTLDLNGWVTLTNQSGISYDNAKLQLVAGEVNQVVPAMRGGLMMDMASAPMAKEEMRAEAAFEYHLYSLDRPTTIKQNQTKQVALLAAQSVPVAKQYLIENAAQVAGSYGQPMGEMPRVNADVLLKLKNDEASHLGLPLPAGIVRVYKADSDGDSIFLGEDSIDHTPKNEKVDLTLGKAFDLTARAKQTEYERISDRVYENAYEVEIKNAKTEAVSVTVREFLPGEWKVLSESHPHERMDSNNAEWQIEVPAEGSATLQYRVRLKF